MTTSASAPPATAAMTSSCASRNSRKPKYFSRTSWGVMGISIVANQSSVHKVLAVIIEFAKRKDGNTVLRCIRDDASVTWQRNDNQHARFFPLHDLTHYSVESELSFAQGFFGLVASGWNID